MQFSSELDLEEIEAHLYSQVYHSQNQWEENLNHPINLTEQRQVTLYSVSNVGSNLNRYYNTDFKSKPLNKESNASVKKNNTEVETHVDNSKNSNNNNQISDVIPIVDKSTSSHNEKNENDNLNSNLSTDSSLVTDKNNTKTTTEKSSNTQNSNNDCENTSNSNNLINNSENDEVPIIPLSKLKKILKNQKQREKKKKKKLEKLEEQNRIKMLQQERARERIETIREKIQRKQTQWLSELNLTVDQGVFKEVEGSKNGPPSSTSNDKESVPPLKTDKENETVLPSNTGKDKKTVSPIIVSKKNVSDFSSFKNCKQNVSPPKTSKQPNNVPQTKSGNENDVQILSDSDSDDVIFVTPPSPKIYSIDSSSENSDCEITTEKSVIENCIDDSTELVNQTIENEEKSICDTENNANNNNNKSIETVNSIDTNEIIIENDDTTNEKDYEDTTINPNQNEVINEIENERAEMLHTPDSNTNDFLTNDVDNLNKNKYSFNFSLHGSDLDLLSNKDITNKTDTNNMSSVNSDVYETESNCSESTLGSKNKSYFNEVEFETSVNEIFAEPNLDKFSNFITPKRTRIKQSNANSFKQSTTKVKDTNEQEENNDEYNSDPTWILPLPVKKKKRKKKSKKKNIEQETFQNEICDNSTFNKEISKNNDTNKIPLEISEPNKKKKRKKKIDLNKAVDTSDSHDLHKDVDQNTEKPSKKKKNKEKIISESTSSAEDSEGKNRKKKSNDETSEDFSNENNSITKIKDKRRSIQMEDDNAGNTASSKKMKKDNVNVIEDVNENIPNDDDTEIDKSKEVDFVSSTNLVPANDHKIERSESNKSSDRELILFVDDILADELEKELSSGVANANETENTSENRDLGKNNAGEFSFIESYKQVMDKDKDVICLSSDNSSVEILSDDIVLNVSFDANKSTTNETNSFSFVKEFEQINKSNTSAISGFSFIEEFAHINNTNIYTKSFKDYWTQDMETFYDKSWGQENYQLEEAQRLMPADPKKWQISAADHYIRKSNSRGPFCMRCRERGHFQYNCPKMYEIVKCSICGESGHLYTRCPNSICTTCRSKTSSHTTTCNKCIKYRHLKCKICNFFGHSTKDCPDLWRRYHLTCEDNGEVENSIPHLKHPNNLWCSNCAERGHIANICNRFRTEHAPTTPQIIDYTPVYDLNESHFIDNLPENDNIPVRYYENVNMSDLRNYKNNLIENNNKKYLIMVRKLIKMVNRRDDSAIYNQLMFLQEEAKCNRFDNRKISEYYRIRNRIFKTR